MDSNDIPDFATLAADPDIAPLLAFEPVPMRARVNGWDAEAQRAFVALLAITGSKLHAAKAVGRNPAGIERMLGRREGAAFRLAVEGAMAVAARRNGKALAQGVAAAARADPLIQAPGQLINEHGEAEDRLSLLSRVDAARENIAKKLIRMRRLFLQEISVSPGKRAAFEILTELPIDWDKAARCEPQPDEPWKSVSQLQPDMILTAESGWSWGEIGYGPDKKAEMRAAIDAHRAEEGLEPVNWDED